MSKKKKLLVGAHTSAAGGVQNALYHGQEIGANVVQFFTTNQRQWRSKKIAEKDISLFKEAKAKTKISHLMSHGGYLINLGSPKKSILKKSQQAFLEEVKRCHLLDIDYLCFHPGAYIDSSEEKCLEQISESLLLLKSEIKKKKTQILLETTAGQGTNVGYKFEHLSRIIKNVKKDIPIGVCIDTCHIFAAGYDIRDKKSWKETLDEFDKKVGLKYLKTFHVNDSLKELGSRRDRHANIGHGKIGIASFKFLMTSPLTRDIPKYLETPVSDKWKDEIKLLRKLGGEL